MPRTIRTIVNGLHAVGINRAADLAAALQQDAGDDGAGAASGVDGEGEERCQHPLDRLLVAAGHERLGEQTLTIFKQVLGVG